MAEDSRLSKFLMNYDAVRSRIFIAHVRFASEGRIAHENTHPFSRQIYGHEITFAHNGTLWDLSTLEPAPFTPVGETDSEKAFCYLLNLMKNEDIHDLSASNCEWFVNKLLAINELGNLNCIISDGNTLLCYHDMNGYNGLFFVRRQRPFRTVSLKDEDFLVDFSKEKSPYQKGFVVATKPLTTEDWIVFKRGELIAFERGEMIFSNKRDIQPQRDILLDDLEISVLALIRQKPSRVSMSEIIRSIGESEQATKKAVLALIEKGYIRQDSRDCVGCENEAATFFTVPDRRPEIRDILRQGIGNARRR